MTSARSTRLFGAVFMMLVAAACSGGSSATSAPSAQGIVVTITPDSTTLPAGGQIAFTASVSGTADQSVDWSVVEGAAGGSITAEGLFTAPRSAGSYHVLATSKADPGSSASSAVTVTGGAPQVVTIAVSPVAVTVAAGASQEFSCAVSGSADTGCTWSVQEGAAGGTVSTSGIYTAPQTAGLYHVVTTSSANPAQVAVAAVTVAAPGPQPVAVAVSPVAVTVATRASQVFTCAVTGSTDTACTWSVQEGTSGGTITSAGRYTAPQTAGTYHVIARSRADTTRSATAAVTVTAPPAFITVAVSPSAATLVTGASHTFTCTVTGSTDTACTWSVEEGASGGTVTSAGRYTAPQAAGTYHVVARSHADSTKSATAAVTVTAPPPPATVAVSPTAATVVTGASQTFTCTVTGSTDTACTWSVEEGASGGTVNSTGRYTAPQTAGTYHVIARSHADTTKSATATVTVTAPPQPIVVAVSPTAATVVAGSSQSFTCTVTGSSDTACTWSVQEGASGGTVTSGGVYTAPQTAGTYHVVARSHADSTKSAAATVTVTAPPQPIAVTVSPMAATVVAGSSQSFACTVTGSSDKACTWSVQEGASGGTVTSGGVYTGPQTAGTYHVVATSHADSSKSASATMTVTAPPVVSVSVSPSSASLDACQTRTFTATVAGTSNSSVTWSVQEAAAGGTVTSGGVYSAPSTAGTYHVVARSQVDTTKSATATVTVAAERVLSVAVNPQGTTVQAGGTVQFTATVTTTCGSFTQTQAVAANGALAN